MSVTSSGAPSNATPDAMRLSRLDRLLDQLGENQLTIRQQGVSLTDLSQRLKSVETKFQTDLQPLTALKSLQLQQDVDVVGQLTALQAAVDTLQRQVASRARERDDYGAATELRVQGLEARITTAEAVLQELENKVDDAAATQASHVDELRQMTRGMLSQVINRIADQFDAVQESLEEVMTSHTRDREVAATMDAALRTVMDAAHNELQNQIASARQETGAECAALRESLSGIEASNSAVVSELQRRQASVDALLENHISKLNGLQEALRVEEERQAGNHALLQDALAVWQRGLEDRLEAATTKFIEYKEYVSRLRREIRDLHDNSKAWNTILTQALSGEMHDLEAGLAQLQQDTAGLLGSVTSSRNDRGG